jgi:2-oxoisovalerate dehydrogenase E1 component
LYSVKDQFEDGDGLMSFTYQEIEGEAPVGEPGVEGPAGAVDVAIVSYANGAYLSRRAIRALASRGLKIRLIDLRWLMPLPIDAVAAAIGDARRVLIVDECRRTGSLSEELMTGLVERGLRQPMARLTAEDSFIPLGAAAYEVLPSEAGIVAKVLTLLETDHAG